MQDQNSGRSPAPTPLSEANLFADCPWGYGYVPIRAKIVPAMKLLNFDSGTDMLFVKHSPLAHLQNKILQAGKSRDGSCSFAHYDHFWNITSVISALSGVSHYFLHPPLSQILGRSQGDPHTLP